MPVKPVVFLGTSLKDLRQFPPDARRDAGYQLDRLQHGLAPDDFKPMPGIGSGVQEIRVWDATGTFRVIYAAREPDAVYVLHAFQKKSMRTGLQDLRLARQRYSELKGP